MIFNAADLVLNFIEAKDTVIDSVINDIDSIINLIKGIGVKWNVTNNVLNAADFILDFI
ncbi:hypothetical protein SDC9_13758 [bioreactor metagenome]|uniref:Uncharacterized protein n=1 Tax=bioreactor metagenome TaxID=1076179 RepID=A0A644TM44_9ZZZZ